MNLLPPPELQFTPSWRVGIWYTPQGERAAWLQNPYTKKYHELSPVSDEEYFDNIVLSHESWIRSIVFFVPETNLLVQKVLSKEVDDWLLKLINQT